MALELRVRKSFWGVNAPFVALAAFLAARIASDFVEWTLRSVEPAATEWAMPAGAGAHEGRAPPSRERLARLCGLPLPPDSAEAPEPEQPLSRSSLRLALLGTLVAADPRWSIASLHDLAAGRSATYMAGDSIQGAEILEIERARVILLNGGRREYVDREPGDRAGTPALGLGPGIREIEVRIVGSRGAGTGSLAPLGLAFLLLARLLRRGS